MTYKIIIKNPTSWGDVVEWEVKKYLELTCDVFSSYVKADIGELTIIETTGGPEIKNIGPQKWEVYLTARNRAFSQYIYEFAHELCHSFSNVTSVKQRSQWISETIGEVASVWALDEVAKKLDNDHSDPTNHNNSNHIITHKLNHLQGIEDLQNSVSLKWFIEENILVLENTNYSLPPSRNLQLMIAKDIWHFFPKNRIYGLRQKS
jgi:hypothetical protein